MGKAQRDKGVRGEREVARIFEAADLPVRGLEGYGDHYVFVRSGLTFHVESKRQERIEILRWSRQAETEAPQGTIPMVAYRPSREPWRISMRLDDLVAILVADRHLVVEHHNIMRFDGLDIGDKCPVCAAKLETWIPQIPDIPIFDLDHDR